MAGVHEALETLDSDALPQEFTHSLRDSPLPPPRKRDGKQSRLATSAPPSDSAGEKEEVPAPRRRGRPPKKKSAS
ncbi:MAG: hypothetical protein DWQ34_24510 [Planctomycetota bacterium]|nr:MAG: hypothetical protein DWQ34_24510 [Planctomycetota bacterium]